MGNRSSEFHPEVRRVRRESSYIYEEFMPTGGTDVKVVYQFSYVLLLLDNAFVIKGEMHVWYILFSSHV